MMRSFVALQNCLLGQSWTQNVPAYCEVIILGIMFITFHSSVVEVQVSYAWPTCDLVLMTATKSCLDWIELRVSFKGPVAVR